MAGEAAVDIREALPLTDIEEELNSDKYHRYVVCSLCWRKQTPGTLVNSLCGRVVRVTLPDILPDCKPCEVVRQKVRAADTPCTFCGHIES